MPLGGLLKNSHSSSHSELHHSSALLELHHPVEETKNWHSASHPNPPQPHSRSSSKHSSCMEEQSDRGNDHCRSVIHNVFSPQPGISHLCHLQPCMLSPARKRCVFSPCQQHKLSISPLDGGDGSEVLLVSEKKLVI